MKNKILDYYIKYPLLWDTIIVSITLLGFHICQKYTSAICLDSTVLNSLVNELLSSSIGIAGFLITALTIILTFKDNLKFRDNNFDNPDKQNEQIKSGIELLFHSRHYRRIVKVFFISSIILVIAFIYFSILDLLWTKFELITLFYLVLGAVIYIVLSVFRCLFILYQIIKLQIKK